jgi:hypothetical protein
MKGCSNLSRRIFSLLSALAFTLLQGWKTPAPFVDLTYFEATFFVRTSLTGGFIVTRGFNEHGTLDHQRFFTGVRLVPSGVENEWLGIEYSKVIRVRADGEATVETGPEGLNDLPASLAFDSTRSRALAVNLAGEGFFFQRPANQPWSLLSGLDNIHLAAISYFSGEDSIWGLRTYQNAPTAPAIFTKFSSDGLKLEDFATNGFPVNIGPGDFACEMVEQPFGNDEKYLIIAKPYTVAQLPGDISRIYRFAPARGIFQLVHETSYTPAAPSVWFTNPNSANAVLAAGSAFALKIEAFDLDADLQSVQLLDNGALVKEWTFDPLPYARTNQLEQYWSPTLEGSHTIVARAQDSRGTTTEKSVSIDVVKVAPAVSVYRNLPTNVIAGQSFTVTLGVSPNANATAYIIKERPPADWTVTGASVDPDTHEITWGPFDNSQIQRTLTYEITAPIGATSGEFSGHVWIDGASNPIFGRHTTYVLPATQTAVQWVDSQHIILNFNAFPGVTFTLESSDALDATMWTQVKTVVGADAPIQVGPIEVPNQQLFYRLRPAF